MITLKIKVGNFLGATIPQDVAARLNVAEGDSVFSRKRLAAIFSPLTIPSSCARWMRLSRS